MKMPSRGIHLCSRQRSDSGVGGQRIWSCTPKNLYSESWSAGSAGAAAAGKQREQRDTAGAADQIEEEGVHAGGCGGQGVSGWAEPSGGGGRQHAPKTGPAGFDE